MKKAIKFFAYVFMKFCRIIPIRNNKIVFSSFLGKMYNDSPRIISERLHECGAYDQVWILPPEVDVPSYIRKVKKNTLKSLYELATARVWIDNSRKDYWISKRKGQLYIQTWHGGVGLKKVEKEAMDVLPSVYIKSAKNDSKMADYFVAETKWMKECYRSSFWYNGKIIEGGIARAQKIDAEKVFRSVRKHFNISPNMHIVVYAPTFRKSKNTDCYDIDYETLRMSLQRRFGGEWCVIIRLHPNILERGSMIHYTDNVFNGTTYPVLNELIIACDVFISDFSSCIFDALHMNKIPFLYASDYDEYVENDRGLCFDLEEFPNGISKTNDELNDTIQNFDEEKYNREKNMLLKTLGFYEADGGDEVLRIIKEVLK